MSLSHFVRNSLYAILLGCICAGLLSACGHEESPALPPSTTSKPAEPRRDTLMAKVRVGDTYASLMRNLDLHPEQLGRLLQHVTSCFPVKLYAGQIYRVICQRPPGGGEPTLESFVLEERGGLFRHALQAVSTQVDTEKVVTDSLAYVADSVGVRLDTVVVRGNLSTNLYEAVLSQGESPALLDPLTQVFAWDIDFFRDPRVGDSFSVLVEKRWREDGVFLGYGQLLCARYVNQGHAFEGFRYRDNYYDGDGRSLEKLLMKAPLKFSRISSGFTASRLHPVLGIRRPHWGVDYAAPTGTPIFAAGDGMVVLAGWSGGFGNCVKIRHNGVFTTYYGHLRGFAAGIRSGLRVRQGQTIGYLGSTGLATGPHLDYRVQKNNAFINPTSLKTEAKEGVTVAEKQAFQLLCAQLLARMDKTSVPAQVATVEAEAPKSNRPSPSGRI